MNAQEQLDEDIGDTEELIRSVEKLNGETVPKYRKLEALLIAAMREVRAKLREASAPTRRYALG